MSDNMPAEVRSLLKEARPTISKKMRQAVFEKSQGHCWYCGDVLSSKWHCDHIEPIRRGDGGCVSSKNFNTLHNVDNLAPACVPCNLFKSVYSLEGFRRKISYQVERTRKSSVNFRVAERFGLIRPTGNDVVFWFERMV
ncbi:HNH endonuclease [Paremcibacter congregatus]|uniref:HNH endonuclease n=1 Tax=Paremcibacter congregatus TaxID=2043170 RepID=UPI0030EB642A